MDISIVIVSWNVKDLLRECLHSIYQQSSDLSLEVFVVDNNSKDGSAEMVKQEFPHVQLIANDTNTGFAFACNQAMKQSSGSSVLLLNPDVQITPQSLDKSHRYLHAHEKVGIVGCHITHPDGSTQQSVRRFPDLVSHILLLTKLHNFFPNTRLLQRYYWSDFNYSQTQPVDQVMGAFFMIKRKLIDTIGMLDQHYYIWYEEVDYCKQALAAGFATHYLADAAVMHHKGQSFKKASAIRKQLILNRSMLYYFFKHKPLWQYCIILLLYPVSIVLAMIVQTLSIKKKNKDL